MEGLPRPPLHAQLENRDHWIITNGVARKLADAEAEEREQFLNRFYADQLTAAKDAQLGPTPRQEVDSAFSATQPTAGHVYA